MCGGCGREEDRYAVWVAVIEEKAIFQPRKGDGSALGKGKTRPDEKIESPER